MRTSYMRVCASVWSLVILNFLVFVVFPPKNWKLGRMFQSRSYKLDISIVNNITVVPYDLDLKSVAGLTKCQEKSELLKGNASINLEAAENNYWTLSNSKTLEGQLPNGTYLGGIQEVKINGSMWNFTSIFQPSICSPIQNLAIIVPFRDRESHLRILLGHLIPILRKQQIGYSIFVVEQLGNDTFNKGRLMNSGFEFAAAVGHKFGVPYDCFVFQDVDLLVEHDDLLYRCTGGDVVDHLSTSIDKFDYKVLCCGMTVGGVMAMGEKQYRRVNGFPNSYWGWGGEDDDINKRIKFRRLTIVRPKEPQGRFTMIKHGPDKGNPYNNNVHKNVKLALRRIRRDGLNNLQTRLVRVDNYPLFTRIFIDVGRP